MDTVEDLGGEYGDLALEEALPPGPMLAWDEEGCLNVAISSVVLREHLPGRIMGIALTIVGPLCPLTELLIHILAQIPMLRK
jgi:hypothetical protein